MRKIRVLHVVSGLDAGGVAASIYNYYINIDREKIHFDFITHGNGEGMIEKLLKKLGCKIYHVTPIRNNVIKNYKGIKEVIKNGDYDVVHVHQNHLSLIALYISSKCNIKTRVIHCHTCKLNEKYYEIIFRNLLMTIIKKLANKYCACGEDAGKWLYGEEFINKKNIEILYNGVDFEKFQYNEINSKEIREKLCIKKDEYVIGHIGRYSVEKNHEYIIKICELLKEKKLKFKILLIGEGQLRKSIEKMILEKNLNDYIIMIGKNNDINKYMSSMNLFVLPSIYEGFPVTLVEAQVNGLECVVSDKVSKEVKISDKIEFIPLEEISEWTNYIESKICNNFNRIPKEINCSKFNIKNIANKLTDIYII